MNASPILFFWEESNVEIEHHEPSLFHDTSGCSIGHDFSPANDRALRVVQLDH